MIPQLKKSALAWALAFGALSFGMAPFASAATWSNWCQSGCTSGSANLEYSYAVPAQILHEEWDLTTTTPYTLDAIDLKIANDIVGTFGLVATYEGVDYTFGATTDATHGDWTTSTLRADKTLAVDGGTVHFRTFGTTAAAPSGFLFLHDAGSFPGLTDCVVKDASATTISSCWSYPMLSLNVGFTAVSTTPSIAAALPTSTYTGTYAGLLPTIGFTTDTAVVSGGIFTASFDGVLGSASASWPYCTIRPWFGLIDTVQGFTKNEQTDAGIVVGGGLVPATTTLTLASASATFAAVGVKEPLDDLVPFFEAVCWLLFGLMVWRDLTSVGLTGGHPTD